MQFPNLRYGNPHEFRHYVHGIPIADIARRLRRSERQIRNYLAEREKLPWWIPEIMRLQRMEYELRMQQMNIQPVRAKFGIVSGSVIEFPAHQPKEPENVRTTLSSDSGIERKNY